MDTSTRRRAVAILRVLRDARSPLGARRLARDLEAMGIDMSERTVRYYLSMLDREGLTRSLGRRGREITRRGEEELAHAFVSEKVGLISAKVDELACRMTFRPRRREGTIILNISTLPLSRAREAAAEVASAFAAGLGMGRLVVLKRPGEVLGRLRVPEGSVGIGTVCSVTINGVLLAQGVPTVSRFAGLLEMTDGEPMRFTEMIHYSGSTLDPLEVFISGRMTSVREVVRAGHGMIGASFREVPAVAVPRVRKVAAKLGRLGLGGVVAIGKPGRPLLEVPVAQGRAGLIVVGGLNPVAAAQEAGIETHNKALTGLVEFGELVEYTELERLAAGLPSRSGAS